MAGSFPSSPSRSSRPSGRITSTNSCMMNSTNAGASCACRTSICYPFTAASQRGGSWSTGSMRIPTSTLMLWRRRLSTSSFSSNWRAALTTTEAREESSHGSHRLIKAKDSYLWSVDIFCRTPWPRSTQRVGSPQPPFQPQCRGGHGKVIRRRGRKPQPEQPVSSLYQGILQQEGIIIPDEPGPPHRRIGDDGSGHQQRADEPSPFQRRLARAVGRGLGGCQGGPVGSRAFFFPLHSAQSRIKSLGCAITDKQKRVDSWINVTRGGGPSGLR